MESVKQHALEAANPTSSLHGQFLSFADVNTAVHQPASLHAVLNYLHRAGEPAPVAVSSDRQWLLLQTTDFGLAERLTRALFPQHVAFTATHDGNATPEAKFAAVRAAQRYDAHHHQHLKHLVKKQRDESGPPTAWPAGPPTTQYMQLKEVQAFYNVTGDGADLESSVPATAATLGVFEVGKLDYNGQVIESFSPADLELFQKLSGPVRLFNFTAFPARSAILPHCTVTCTIAHFFSRLLPHCTRRAFGTAPLPLHRFVPAQICPSARICSSLP
jgi:hypothetical protein